MSKSSYLNVAPTHPKKEEPPLNLAQIAKEVHNGEAFVPVVNEEIFEFAMMPAFRAIRRQLFGKRDDEAGDKRALEYFQSKAGDKLLSCLYDYAAFEMLRKAEELSSKK